MDINGILKHLPHRYPFLLIDRVLAFDAEAETLTALKNVSVNEPFFTGHFPEYPVMPGVLMIEAMAQTTAVCAFSLMEARNITRSPDDLFFFAGADRVRFKKPVIPGDQLIITTTIGRSKSGVWKAQAEAKVDDQLACSADILAAYRERK